MSLLTIHPKYLDKQSLFALWREGLSAQKAMLENKSSPKLSIFQNSDNPQLAISSYLSFIASEGARRGYKLSHEKIHNPSFEKNYLTVNNQQIIFEINHLKSKLKIRDKARFREISRHTPVELNPIFNTLN